MFIDLVLGTRETKVFPCLPWHSNCPGEALREWKSPCHAVCMNSCCICNKSHHLISTVGDYRKSSYTERPGANPPRQMGEGFLQRTFELDIGRAAVTQGTSPAKGTAQNAFSNCQPGQVGLSIGLAHVRAVERPYDKNCWFLEVYFQAR